MADWKVPAGTAALVVVAAAAVQLTGPAPVPPSYVAPPARSAQRTAVVWVHDEWSMGAAHATQLGRACPEGPLLASEVQRVTDLLTGLGYEVAVRAAPTPLDDLLAFDLVVAHDGGWGSRLTPEEREGLEALRLARVPVLLLGDDAGMRIRQDPEVQGWFGISRVVHNGLMPATLSVPGGPPPFPYEKEVDLVHLAPGTELGGQTTEGAPLGWVAGDRTAVLLASLRSSDVCPVASPDGEEALGRLFQGLVRSITR